MPMRLPISAGVRRISGCRIAALAVAAWLAAGSASLAAAPPSKDALIGELDAVRRESVAAAHAAQQNERALADLDHQIALLQREAAAGQRGLEETRPQQAALLGVLERIARNPPEGLGLTPEAPLDRIRSGMLIAAVVPELRNEAQALTAEIERVARIRTEIPKDQAEAATRRDALARNHELLAHLAARRTDIAGKLGREEAGLEAKLRGLAEHAASLPELIKKADAAQPEKQASANDPARPKTVRSIDPAKPELLLPVGGEIARRFDSTAESGEASQRLVLRALPGGEVVAPFDGKVVYAAPYKDNGLVLIIRHGGLYHSVLAGLGRADVRPGEWVMAGEPVGVLPEASASKTDPAQTDRPQIDASLSFELRHEDRAIDPEPLLASDGDGTGRAE